MRSAALEDRRVLVTGASRGIGLAVTQELTLAGAWIAMVARSEPDLSAAAAQVGGYPIAADVSSLAGVDHVATALRDLIGGAPDIIVNAAGAFGLAPFAETSPTEFDRQIEVNLRGPFLVTRKFLPEMLARRSGHIVNVGSISGRLPLPGNAAYTASKFGLRGLHEVLSAELRGSGVRATLVEPAATETSLWDPIDPDSRDDLPSRDQMLRPEDVARTVLFALVQPPDVEISHLAVRSAK